MKKRKYFIESPFASILRRLNKNEVVRDARIRQEGEKDVGG